LPKEEKERKPRRHLENLKLGIGKRLLRSGLAIGLVKRTFAGQFSSAKAHEQAAAQFALDLAEKAYVNKKSHVIWLTAYFPAEIVWGLGLVPFHPEIASAVGAAIGLSEQSLTAADTEGYPRDLCTFHRNIVGLHHLGMLPKVDVCVPSTSLCDTAGRVMANLAYVEQRPLLVLDVPSTYNRESILYVERQLRQLIDDLCATTGVAYDEDRLKEAVRLSNTAWDHGKAAWDLRTAHPAPLKGSSMLSQLALLAAAFGSPHGAIYYRALRDYLADLVAKKTSEQPIQRCRIYWMHLGPFCPTELLPHLEDDLGAVIAFEEESNIWWPRLDEQRPLYSLAEKALSHFGNGPVENRIQQILHDVDKYAIDGVIHWNHWGCRQSTGALRVIGDRLRAEGIPFLQLDGDCIDARNFQWGPVRTRLEGFMEMIA